VSPASKVERRRTANRQEARELLQNIVSGEADPYMAYRRLYVLWCSNNAALQELRPLFRMEGIEPDGHIIVTVEFREQIVLLAHFAPGQHFSQAWDC
jgi:hypothetical protein